MSAELLPELDKIDWSYLGYPDVPKWVRNLASDNQGLRIEAFRQLEKLLAYAGTTPWENYGPISELLKTEMPVYVAPFLVELLKNENGHKSSILQLLDDLATYPSLITPNDDKVYQIRAESVFEEVKKGIPIFKALVSDDDISVQRGAMSVLQQIESST